MMRMLRMATLLIFLILMSVCLGQKYNQTVNDQQKRTTEDLELIRGIVDGGTNSGAALTNGKLIYSASSALVEAPYLKSADGKSLTVSDSGATSVSPVAPVKLNLIGVDGSLSSGPHINVYTSGDNYPLMQELSFSHNNEAISFDSYWDGAAWRSSHSGSNFQIYKQYNQLQFRYASGIAAGSSTSQPTSFYIDNTGRTVFSQPIMLPSGNTYLNYYTDRTFNCSLGVDGLGYGFTVSWLVVRVTRMGKLVTYTFPQFTGNITTAGADHISVLGSCFPSDLLPDGDIAAPITVRDFGNEVGLVSWAAADSYYSFYSLFGSYRTATNVGTLGQSTLTFIKTS